ncbi:MAG: AP-3 complex subunit beta [Thelocarpon superellum]|nr:MAG: AP-3 complex subunit beta [Thelocarpon superellum]
MESISKLSSLLETARDLTLEAAHSAGSARGLRGTTSTRPLPAAQLKRLLDSRNDRDILEGLRRVISMMYRTQPSLPFFSSVIKNVASPNIEIKKLVYIYLVHHAEAEPDLALLSINTIQKSLTDQNPQVRAMALKVMSGIRVPVISQIVSLAIKKGSGDMSPHVRKAAALAIPKCYRLDPGTLPQLRDYLSVLLGDRQYYVVGAAIVAFMDICPDRIDLIHKHYRGLVRKLVDIDEWGQLATLRLMTEYARKCFPQRRKKVPATEKKGFYDEDGVVTEGEEREIQVLDPDLELLLKACRPLLRSRNSAVVVAVARCYLYLAPHEYLDLAVGPLVALLRSNQDIQQIALYNIVNVCLARPEPFVKYATRFLVHGRDAPHVWLLKLEVLTVIFPHCGMHFKGVILSELEHFSRGADTDLVRESVRAIGRCAQSDTRTSSRCLQVLLGQISSSDGNLVAESLTVIRHLIQQDPSSHTKTVIRLAKNMDTATNPQARASIIWLVGEFAGIDGENNIAPDVLRILAKGFADEAEPAKLQIILLAAKVYVHHLNRTSSAKMEAQPPTILPSTEASGPDPDPTPPSASTPATTVGRPPEDQEHPIAVLWKYILLLARYDTSYDLRDRARLYKALLSIPASPQLASLLLLAPKPVPHTPSPSEDRKGFTLGSASLIIGAGAGGGAGAHGIQGYEDLPDWVEPGHEPDPRLRDEGPGKAEYHGEKRLHPAGERLDGAVRDRGKAIGAGGATVFGKTNGVPVKEKTLDDWLAEDNGGDDEEESEEEDEDEEDDEVESSEEEEGDEDEDEDESDESDESEDGNDQEHHRLVR